MEAKIVERKRTSNEKLRKDSSIVEEEVDDEIEEEEESGGAGGDSNLPEEDRRKGILGGVKRGSSGSGGVSPPSCQAERCGADLTDAKRYHRRHKVCEFHSKAPVVMVAGLRQRFCQQCSRCLIP